MTSLTSFLNSMNVEQLAEDARIQGAGKSTYFVDRVYDTTDYKGDSRSCRVILFDLWNTALNNQRGSISPYIKLYKAMDRIVKALYSNVNSSEKIFSTLRKSIIARFGIKSRQYELSLLHMGLSPAEISARRRQYAEQVQERNFSRDSLEPIYIEDVLSTIKQLAASEDPIRNLIACLLATGTRQSEAASLSEFKPVSGNSKMIEVVNLAKSRPGKTSIRPVLGMRATEVIELIKKIRTVLNVGGTIEQVTNRFSIPLNMAFKTLFGNRGMTVHKSRYIYANVCFALYAEGKKIPYESYLSSILGHESADSTKSYLAINIQHKPTEAKAEEPKADNIEFERFKNIRRKFVTEEEKIENIINAVNLTKSKGMRLRQDDLRIILGYSSLLMTKAYKIMRARQA